MLDSSYLEAIQPQSDALSRKAMNSYAGSHCLNSIGRTFSNQDVLPRLPIPTLQETMAKLPLRLQAILDENDLAIANDAIKKFVEAEGPELQDRLIHYEKEGFETLKIGSYVEEFWNEAYLSPDVSTVMNMNPFFILEDGPDPKTAKDQLRRAASLCFASLKFASSLRNEAIEPDMFRGKPLCMDQFKVLFGSSRQPVNRLNTNLDDVHVYSDSSHVVVLCKNQFYYFTALWPDTGRVGLDEADVLEILTAIAKHASQISPTDSTRTALGALTALPRSEWAKARLELCRSHEVNKLALKVIDSSLFVLVLDDFAPSDIHAAAANALHGTNELVENDTLQVGSCLNRWYDKLQVIICSDGTSQINFEHATIDGHTALRFVSDVYAETVINFADSIVNLVHGKGRISHVIDAVVERFATTKDNTMDALPKKLVFEFPKSTLDRIYYAESAICDSVGACDTFVLEFTEYGKHLIVANEMSPDAFVQMSILLAYYKLYGRVVCMYEPAMTKAFYHGRTEAIRGATIQAKEFCRIWCDEDENAANEEKLSALRVATAEHSRLTKEASCGKGIDRHLYSLKCLAQRTGLSTPTFFNSIAWKALTHTVISTSNCGNPSLRLFGFGPVVPDGFGIGYIIKEHGISYSVCSKERQTRRFVGSLRLALKEMGELLSHGSIVTVRQRIADNVTEKQNPPELLRLDTYGDLWGEHSIPIPTQNVPVDKTTSGNPTSSSSKLFASVSKHEGRIDLLGIQHIKIDVDLPKA